MVKIRRAYEVLFLGLFLFFLLITDLRYLKGWPVSLFLEATPLVAVATALTTHTLYRNLVWGLVIIAITMMLGRVWCNWMCPFGILHHLFGWIGNRRNTKQMIEVNRYRKIYAIKYYILAAMLAMASLWIIPTVLDAPGKIVAGVPGQGADRRPASRASSRRSARGSPQSAEEHKRGNSTLQIGLLDPIALTVRSMTTSVLPTVAQGDREHLHRAPRVLAGLGRRPDLHRLPGRQLVDPPLLLPGDLPAGGPAGGLQPVRALADRPRPGPLHRLRPLPQELRGGLRPARRPPQERVLRLPELHRGLPARRPLVPVPAPQGERGHLPGRRPPAAGPGRALRPALLPDGPALGRGAEELQPGGDPPPRLGRRGRVPPPLHQVRPVHPRLPDQRPPAEPVRGGRRGALDADHDLEDGLVRAELHPVQPGLPHRRDPRDLDRREARRRPVRGQGADQDRHRLLQPGPLPPLGDGHRAASSARRSARSAPRRSSPATSR